MTTNNSSPQYGQAGLCLLDGERRIEGSFLLRLLARAAGILGAAFVVGAIYLAFVIAAVLQGGL
ncbi:MAG: hypothetical protein WAX33_04310 [Rectinemataceae bacterium]